MKKIDTLLAGRSVQTHQVRQGLKPLARVKNVIAIASGKGGVGKSTTTVNLALALQAMGARVGVLDADIYGPNQAHMLGADGGLDKPPAKDQLITPVVLHGLQTMSMAYMIEAETPMVWRGPMVSGALQQLFFQTDWKALDYLLIDLPPGTGDIQLTLAQKIPVTASIIVTTPQDIALLDARKGLEMFRKVGVPVLGVVENMCVHTCSQCGYQEAIFGENGAEKMAGVCDTVLLGRLPLARSIREAVDQGKPSVVAAPESDIAIRYFSIAEQLVLRLANRPKDHQGKMPGVVVE